MIDMENQEKMLSEAAPAQSHRSSWRLTRQLTVCLLASWLLLSFGVLYFARELSNITFFGWPLSFYMAAQGLTLLYVALLGIFSIASHRIERNKGQTGKLKHREDN